MRGVIATKNIIFTAMIKKMGRATQNTIQVNAYFDLKCYNFIARDFNILVSLQKLFNLLFLIMKLTTGRRIIRDNIKIWTILFTFLKEVFSEMLNIVSAADIVKKGAKPDSSSINLWKRVDQLKLKWVWYLLGRQEMTNLKSKYFNKVKPSKKND